MRKNISMYMMVLTERGVGRKVKTSELNNGSGMNSVNQSESRWCNSQPIKGIDSVNRPHEVMGILSSVEVEAFDFLLVERLDVLSLQFERSCDEFGFRCPLFGAQFDFARDLAFVEFTYRDETEW